MPDHPFCPGPDEQWETLLHQLRQQTAAAPAPALYGRVQARLTAAPAAPLAWLRRPAYALALSLLVLAVSSDGAAVTAGSRPAHPARRAQP